MVQRIPRQLHCLQFYEVSSYNFLLYLIYIYSSFSSAEIDQLKKLQAAKPKESDAEEIPRPAKMTSLQAAMGLTENKKLYSYCRVSLLCSLPFFILND
jgi:hypothetical protein